MAKKTFVVLMIVAMLAMMVPVMAGAEELELVGELEGPTLVFDPAQFPTEFNEAPMLAELVEAGELPPVAERLPEDPLVIQPLESIGNYGGTWRRGFTGPMDGENGNRIVSSDRSGCVRIGSSPRVAIPNPAIPIRCWISDTSSHSR